MKWMDERKKKKSVPERDEETEITEEAFDELTNGKGADEECRIAD